ncbi:DMT family transporter [Natroniella acetigena]|uniref:DMT family transporter n=1 Tax=Natroniella acetigena TaxID=52004 RepID=UPI00200ADF4F|nr:DMT family transporter [Natroniella acetigena]MCK8828238.1 DMT family transporter [Natroniella acetigena]
MGKIFFFIVAAVSGTAMAVQGSLNSALGKVVGEVEATFIVHMIATLVIALILFAFNLGQGNLGKFMSAPWYTYLGGLLNVIILYGVLFSIPRLGVANATTLIIVGQVLTAILIDHLGIWGLERIPFRWIQGLGLVLLAIGARLLLNIK